VGSRFRGNDNGAGMTITPAKAGVQCWRLSHLFLTGAPAIFMAAKNLSILRIKHFRDSSSPQFTLSAVKGLLRMTFFISLLMIEA